MMIERNWFVCPASLKIQVRLKMVEDRAWARQENRFTCFEIDFGGERI
jgi:hypothetical protein